MTMNAPRLSNPLKVAFAIVLLCVLAVPASAQRRSSGEQLLSLAVSPSSKWGKPERLQMINLLLTYCREVLAALPTNTPAEAAWVENEGRTTDTRKIARLTSSPEYARFTLQDTFQTCVDRASDLAALQAKHSSNKIGHVEAARLVSLAANFNYDQDILSYAKRAGLDVDQFQLDQMSGIRRMLLVASLRAFEE
jgi:hypothetical protein